MQPFQVRRAAIILLGIILIVFVVVQGVRFAGNLGQDDSPVDIVRETSLEDFADTDSQVRLTYSGPVEGQEEFDQIRMTISRNRRTLEIISGYGQNVSKSQRLSNTPEAYAAFLRALQLNNFTQVQANDLGDDARGVCFRGKRIVGEVIDSGQTIESLWAASCGRSLGTMNARWRDILKLFESQFPDYRDFTREVRF